MATGNADRMAEITGTSGTRGMAKVLLVEDDEGTRETVSFILSDAGYEVIEAANGEQGCATLTVNTEPMVVLLDYRLPKMDGCDLLEIVRQDEALRERHAFVMMSASPKKTEEDCDDALDELDVPLLGKPFDIDELVEAVADAQARLVPTEESA